MSRVSQAFGNLKETLLIITVLYFYGLAFALIFHRDTYGLDQPGIFLFVGILFFIALVLEAVLAFWDKLKFLFWVALGIVSFAIIGLYLAPALYGSGILVYVFLEPLIIALIGGFAFSTGHILSTQLFSTVRLTSPQLSSALARLPGWTTVRGGIEKTYRFTDFSEALNFLNRVATYVNRSRHRPEFALKGTTVSIHLTTPGEGGITATDIAHAKKFDSFA